MHQAFDDTPEYKTYLGLAVLTNEEHIKILLELYRFLSNHDLFIELSEYGDWQDSHWSGRDQDV